MDFIEAWFNENEKGMVSLLKKETDNSSISAMNAIVTNECGDKKNNFESLMEAIDDPPAEINLFAILLYLAFVMAKRKNHLAEKKRIIQIFDNIDLSKAKNISKALHYLCLSQDLVTENKTEENLEMKLKAEKLYPKGSSRWYLLKINTVLLSILYKKDIDVEKAIAMLKKYPQYKFSSYPPEYLQARYDESVGKISKALQEMEKIKTPSDYGTLVDNIISQKVKLLWRLAQVEEGDLVLENYFNDFPESIRARSSKFLLAERCLMLNDPNGLKMHIRGVFQDNELPFLTHFWAKYLLLSAELIQRETASARRILKSLDPSESNHDLLAEWIRLYLQEENYAVAAYYLQKMQTVRPNYLLEFRNSHEMKISDLSRLTAIINENDFVETKQALEKPKENKSNHNNLFSDFVGNSESIISVKENIRKYADHEIPVLITGVTGTGKEEVAKLLHQLSSRSAEPFIPVNCGAISSTLMEAELFGYKKGAFTGAIKDHVGLFESAGKGTLFLDEISSMPLSLQASLLRVLETMNVRPVGSTKLTPIKARVIAATNIRLETLLEQKKFRMDLYFRLNRLQINLPSLQERKEDIPLLAQHFLDRYFDQSDVIIDDKLMEVMKNYSWPGNIRELRNEIERMAIMAGSNKLLTSELVSFNQTNDWQIADNIIGASGNISQEPKVKSFRVNEAANIEPTQKKVSLEGGVKKYSDYRREELRGLFQEHRLLTRAMVARFLGCAANTAALDLKALESEGYLKKIIPTDSPRSSYYILNN